jgi:arsenate reductase
VLARAGLTPHDALSKRSRAYKDLGLAGRTVSDDELLDLMIAEPTLLRRPLVIGEKGSTLGFDRKRLEELTREE